MSSKINLQTCEYARKSSIFQDNQLIFIKIDPKTSGANATQTLDGAEITLYAE